MRWKLKQTEIQVMYDSYLKELRNITVTLEYKEWNYVSIKV
jgi:hypothetical protein